MKNSLYLLCLISCIVTSQAVGDSALFTAAAEDRQDIMSFLLEHGAHINARSRDGSTILHLAAARGNVNTVRFILDAGINLGLLNDVGLTALHVAALYDHRKVINILLTKGADINSVSSDGSTILHLAAANNMTELVRHILQFENVLLSPKNMNLFTPSALASRSGHTYVALLLGRKIGDISVDKLITAVEHLNLEEVKSLVLRGADVNGFCTEGWTPLHKAAGHSLAITSFLVEHGADVNQRATNDRTVALYEAAWWGNLDVVKYLVENGAEINPIVAGGWTPMAAAYSKDHQNVVQYLRSKGGKIVKPPTDMKAFRPELAYIGALTKSNQTPKKAKYTQYMPTMLSPVPSMQIEDFPEQIRSYQV